MASALQAVLEIQRYLPRWAGVEFGFQFRHT